MLNNRKSLILFFGALILLGCAGPKRYLTFEILDPAPITYPVSVEKVGYLNRSPLSINSFDRINQKGLDPVSMRIIDTIVCNNLRKGFVEGKEFMDLSYLEDVPVLEERRRDTTGQDTPMSDYFLDRLFSENQLDALVVLEYYQLRLTKTTPFYDTQPGSISVSAYQEYRLNLEVLWRIYVQGATMHLDEYLLNDTLYFVDNIEDSNDILNPTDVIREGCREFGFRYGLRQIPKWTPVTRFIYGAGDKQFREALKYTNEGNWDDATDIWQSFTNDEDSEIAARANHNLAVRYELMDSLFIARKYAAKADSLWADDDFSNYYKLLNDRIASRDTIFLQVR